MRTGILKLLLVAGLLIFLFNNTSLAAGIEFDRVLAKGFLHGLLDGFLAPLKFIIGLFDDGWHIYEVNNVGAWYDFGFLLGIGGFSGGIFRSSRRRRR